MASEFKNANKQTILNKLIEWRNDKYPFNNLVLQHDTFWIYCNSRRYWGTYKAALRDAGVNIGLDFKVMSEYGYEIDWWPYVRNDYRREWLALVLDELYKRGGDIKPASLKKSNYFDLCTDSYLLFGKYEKALEYAQISLSEKFDYENLANMEPTAKDCVNLYLSSNQEEKTQILTKLKCETILDDEKKEHLITRCPVIVDGSNIARNQPSRDKPTWQNVKLIDQYLQSRGFVRDKIIFIFDANFPYNVDINDFNEQSIKDRRLCLCPSREQADAHILTKAFELQKAEPNSPPYIISNDKFDDYIIKYPELESLIKTQRRGVTWTFIQKKLEPVINFSFG